MFIVLFIHGTHHLIAERQNRRNSNHVGCHWPLTHESDTRVLGSRETILSRFSDSIRPPWVWGQKWHLLFYICSSPCLHTPQSPDPPSRFVRSHGFLVPPLRSPSGPTSANYRFGPLLRTGRIKTPSTLLPAQVLTSSLSPTEAVTRSGDLSFLAASLCASNLSQRPMGQLDRSLHCWRFWHLVTFHVDPS